MKRSIPVLAAILLFASVACRSALADGETHAPTQEEKAFYASVVAPALTAIESAMPPAPQGWAIESRTTISSSLPDQVAAEPGSLRYEYAVVYKRVDGVADEQKRLDEAAAAVQKEANEAAAAKTKKLTGHRNLTRQAVAKAHNNNDAVKEKQYKRQLEKIERELNAVTGEAEQKIMQATEPLLVRDAGIRVRVSLDEDAIAFPEGKAITRPKVAYALRREGMRVGVTGWKEAEILFLYGDWQEVQPNTFRARTEKSPFRPKPQTIMISITGESERTSQFLRQLGLKNIVGLMK